MSKNFSDMSVEEQAALAQQVATVLKDNDLGDVKVEIYREEVCQLTQTEVKGRTMLKAKKNLPSFESAKAERFNEAVKPIINGVDGVDVAVNSIIGVGDQYKTITNVNTLESSDAFSIEHTPGTVMLIDFWATWCPPCQRPMQHNQDMLTEHGDSWKDKVKIIGLSIDRDAATVKKHIESKGWTKPIHYWRSKSDCSDVYQVQGVPHVMLIDTEGKIVFKGHPANRKDLVKDFNDLLAGKKLEGVEAEDGDEEEAGTDGPSATLEDIKAAMEQMTRFQDIGKELQNECKNEAVGMMRNFNVLTIEAALNPKTDKWTSEFTNHRVLIGPAAKVKHCKEKIEAKMGAGENE